MGDNVNLKTDQDKRDNFLTYSNLRLDNAIRAIKTIGNLKNQRAYKYNEEDIKNIETFIKDELDKVIKQLKGSLNGEIIQVPKREVPKRII
jgi:hypothetical protein